MCHLLGRRKLFAELRQAQDFDPQSISFCHGRSVMSSLYAATGRCLRIIQARQPDAEKQAEYLQVATWGVPLLLLKPF